MLADGSCGDSGRTTEEPAVTKTLHFGQRAGWGIRTGRERKGFEIETEERVRRGKVSAGDLNKHVSFEVFSYSTDWI